MAFENPEIEEELLDTLSSESVRIKQNAVNFGSQPSKGETHNAISDTPVSLDESYGKNDNFWRPFSPINNVVVLASIGPGCRFGPKFPRAVRRRESILGREWRCNPL